MPRAVRGIVSDVRLALRMIRREPASTAAIVVTLALGIGATTATYAVFNAVLFRPLPGVRDPGSLVTIETSHDTPDSSPRRLVAALRGLTALDGPAVGYKTSVAVSAGVAHDTELLDVMVVLDKYLSVLGVRARLGRLITDEETVAGADVAVISARFWRSHFGGAASAIGAPLRVSGHLFTVVGVMDAYEEWGPSHVGTVVAWVPGGTGDKLVTRASHTDSYLLVGRLRPGATRAVAEAQVRARYVASSPPGDPGAKYPPFVSPGLHADGSDEVARDGLAVYRLMLGATAVLLLLAGANAANLLLARLARRARALALRAALGAGRARLLSLIAIESAVLAAVSAVAGLAVASLLTRTLIGTRPFQGGPTLIEVSMDWRVMAFASAIAAVTLLAFGTLPAIAGSRADVRYLLQQSGRTGSSGGRTRRLLVVVQLALALVLVSSAGVLTRSVAYLRSLQLGMQPDRVTELTIRPRASADERPAAYPMAREDALIRAMIARFAQIAGVTAVGVGAPAAFAPEQFVERVAASAEVDGPAVPSLYRVVSGGYFSALGMPLVAGRTFAEAEYFPGTRRPTGVAIVSEALARDLFGGGPAVGQHVKVDERAAGVDRGHERSVMAPADSAASPRRDVEVIGVVGDTRSGSPYLRAGGPAIYEPDHLVVDVETLYVRSTLPADEIEGRLRAAMRDLEPRMPLQDVMTLRQEIDALFPEDRAIANLMRVVAGLALALGLFGVAAVMACTLAERTRELGIRVALGASTGRLTRDVLRPAALTSVAGVAIGLALFVLVSSAVAAYVHGVHPLDPLTLVGATSLLFVAALAAAWLPTRRAARVDPTVALRAE